MTGSSLYVRAAVVAGVVAGVCSSAVAGPVTTETRVFNFAGVGISYTAILLGSDPIVGREIVETRITLNLDVTGGDAANFATDIALPIDPFPGNVNVFFLNGAGQGWSGTGEFNYAETTDRFNGVFFATIFGAATPGAGYTGSFLEGSRIEVDYIVPAPGSAALLGLSGLAMTRRRR